MNKIKCIICKRLFKEDDVTSVISGDGERVFVCLDCTEDECEHDNREWSQYCKKTIWGK